MIATVASPRIANARPAPARLARVGGALFLVAFASAVLIRTVAAAALDPPTGYDPYRWTSMLVAVLVPTVGAGLVYAAFERFTRNGPRNYAITGSVALAASLGGPANAVAQIPGTTVPLAWTLALLHLVVGTTLIVGYAKWGRAAAP